MRVGGICLTISGASGILDNMSIEVSSRPHQFHIPVMGTGFSLDTPLRIARYGISSVISLSDDILVEQMRKVHCEKNGLEYVEITERDEDARAKRITAYLNLLDNLIAIQVNALQASPFEPGSEITRYFEMLPDSDLKTVYQKMMNESDPTAKAKMQDSLRPCAVPGTIDVNIMTKLDRDRYKNGIKLAPEFADAMAGLRGYARSSVKSSLVFSAGINTRLYGYLSSFDDFFLDKDDVFPKKIVLKVSDYRSAMIQGKYLAKRGVWISEFRIESGLNCGGHAFVSEGSSMGLILEDFKNNKTSLTENLHKLYNKALADQGRPITDNPPDVLITVQGGIGTAEEHTFLLDHYGVDATGWGTPFMLVPEVTTVDPVHLEKLVNASDSDVYLSDSSPMGIPFWSLRDSASEHVRLARLAANKPGSACPKGFLVSDTEFTKVPICRASRVYQKRKLAQLAKSDLTDELRTAMNRAVTARACICHDLGGGVLIHHGVNPNATPAVCCGPNIVNFSKLASLEEMINHIYGRLSLLTNPDRSHMFSREISLNIEYLQKEIQRASEGLIEGSVKRFADFKMNLESGIEYYRGLAEQFSTEQKEKFLGELDALFAELETISPEPIPAV